MDNDYRERVQKRIRELCTVNNKSLNDVSDDSTVPIDTIKSIMAKKRKEIPRIDTLDLIAHGFGLTASEFLDESSDRILIERIPTRYQEMYARLERYQKEFILKAIYLMDKENEVILDDITE